MTSTWGRTPSFGAQTPMVGSMTPSYSMTPMHGAGSRTPMYGSQTPMHDGEFGERALKSIFLSLNKTA